MILTKPQRSFLKTLSIANPALYFAINGHRTHRGRPLTWEHNLFQAQLYQDMHPWIAISKSTQCGVSEWLMTTAIGSAYSGRNVFYVFPTGLLVGRFVRERFDKTMQMTPIYQQLGSQEKDQGRKNAMSVTMKQLGRGTIAFVGSNSPSSFTEFAADISIIDELDKCDPTNILMTPERLSAADRSIRREIKVSNPTITGFGIDAEYALTDQQEWHIRCDCGEMVKPDWWTHVVKEIEPGQFLVRDTEWDWDSARDIRLICDKCGKPFDRYGSGAWVPTYPTRAGMNWGKRGYHVSKLFSANVPISEMLEKFVLAEANEQLMTRFWNAELGLAYDAPGARIRVTDLDECIGEHHLGTIPADGACIAGIDVGSVFHVTIGHMAYGEAGIRLVEAKEIVDPEDVIDLLHRYKVKCFVIDAMPETRVSKTIARRLGNGFVCYYAQGKRDTIGKDMVVTVDRTSALDNVKAAVTMKALILPVGAANIPDYYDQMTASSRIYDEEAKNGEGYYNWVEGSKADHYFHSTGYMLMAGRLLLMAKR